MFNEPDIKQIKNHGMTADLVKRQISQFQSGFPPTRLHAAALVNNGIIQLKENEITAKEAFYENNRRSLKLVKFVPASGAATRMFKSLFAFLLEYHGSEEDQKKMNADQSKGSLFTFFKDLKKFAFYQDLAKAFQNSTGRSLEEALDQKEYSSILEVLLKEEGLAYGSLPKGLLKFHCYGKESRTPVEEHMEEGALYAQDADGLVNLHFTVSPEHQEKFQLHVSEAKPAFEKKHGVKIQVSYSIQKPSTDTIAVDPANVPFRNEDGTLLFRPAGHGALLENLNEIEADLVFLKNIDNVVPDRLKAETILYKKVIAGILLEYQDMIAEAQKNLASGEGLAEAKALLENHLGFKPGPEYDGLSSTEKVKYLIDKLHRPLRVCGMVKNDGDPGGGPFWVQAADGSISLQVVETAQIDLTDPVQKSIFNQATHFNPVDVVCLLKDADGKKYDLLKYRDPNTGFITQKSKDGKDLKAMELPGLWNGSMADWNTVFVEVPSVTFNPVKSVNDLLNDAHQG